jgi:hypothetical protein
VKLPLHRLDTTGATVGDVPQFDGTDYVPVPLSTSTIWIPLTAVGASGPELVWDGDDELILIEVPTP